MTEESLHDVRCRCGQCSRKLLAKRADDGSIEVKLNHMTYVITPEDVTITCTAGGVTRVPFPEKISTTY